MLEEKSINYYIVLAMLVIVHVSSSGEAAQRPKTSLIHVLCIPDFAPAVLIVVVW